MTTDAAGSIVAEPTYTLTEDDFTADRIRLDTGRGNGGRA